MDDPYLREFVAEAEELDRRRLLGTFRPSLHGSYVAGLFADDSPKADADDFIAFVTQLRVFWMRSERFYRGKVYEAALAAPDALREPIEESRRWWELLEGPGSVQIDRRTPNGQERTLTNRQIADKWINGFILHRRRKDRDFIESLDPFGRRLAEYAFHDYLFGYAGEVMALALAIERRAVAESPRPGRRYLTRFRIRSMAGRGLVPRDSHPLAGVVWPAGGPTLSLMASLGALTQSWASADVSLPFLRDDP